MYFLWFAMYNLLLFGSGRQWTLV